MILKVAMPGKRQFKMFYKEKFFLRSMFRQGEIHYIGGADVLPAP